MYVFLPFLSLSLIPSHPQGPVGDLLHSIGRHNMRLSHIHLAVEAKGYRKLVAALPRRRQVARERCRVWSE